MLAPSTFALPNAFAQLPPPSNAVPGQAQMQPAPVALTADRTTQSTATLPSPTLTKADVDAAVAASRTDNRDATLMQTLLSLSVIIGLGGGAIIGVFALRRWHRAKKAAQSSTNKNSMAAQSRCGNHACHLAHHPHLEVTA